LPVAGSKVEEVDEKYEGVVGICLNRKVKRTQRGGERSWRREARRR
jgi:hypothetical protein